MREITLVKAGVVEGDLGFGAILFELKFRNRVLARVPGGGTPRLYDSLVGNQFNVASYNLPPEHRKGPSRLTTDFG